jgi:hypothetical protein
MCFYKQTFITALAFTAFVSALAVGAAAPQTALLFEKVAAPENLDLQYKSYLCAVLPQPSVDGSKDFRLTSVQPLVMARVKRDATGLWTLTQLLDFSGYHHSMAAVGPLADTRLSLAPALYPLADGKWAVAVLFLSTGSYSGGGADFTTADFVPVDEGAADSKVTVAAVRPGIPFSCSRRFGACFSEKQYQTSRHCHDENDGELRVSYGLPAKAGEPYRWTFNWSETEWLAAKPKKTMKTTRVRFISAEDAAGKVLFCGGPAS